MEDVNYLTKHQDGALLTLLINHGDLPVERVAKWSNTKRILVCNDCIQRAELEYKSPSEEQTFKLFHEFLEYLESVDIDASSERNTKLLALIMHKLATFHSSSIDSEIQTEIKTILTHETLKEKSGELHFLSCENRSSVLMGTLTGFAKLNFDCDLETLSERQLYALCSAYEAIMSSRHSKVTTAPAIMRNLMLMKTTHNRELLEAIGAPSGGKHTLLSSIMNSNLPRLYPPANDFVNCDDNLQVKRVVSSSKLREGFKHTVKVVNSHVYLQNSSDQDNRILQEKSNKPESWLKKPTKSDVDEFDHKIKEYEMEGRKVRGKLLTKWLDEEKRDLDSNRDPVGKLIRLRKSRPDEKNIYPCLKCGGEGKMK